MDGITPGQGIEVHGDGWLIQAFPSQKETHMFIYKRIPPTTTKIPFSSVVTENDVAEFYDAQLTPQVSFKDIWDKRYAQGTANYEEGIVQVWNYGRIALVGDAVHKASITILLPSYSPCSFSRPPPLISSPSPSLPLLLFCYFLQANHMLGSDLTEAGRSCKCWHGSSSNSHQ